MIYYDDNGRRIHRPVRRRTPSAVIADGAPCAATFREDPMPYGVPCGERGYHLRHISGGGSEYYTWLDGDEGAGTDG